MRDEILVNRRQVHRRVVPGLKRLQARFSPTAVFDSGSTAPTVTLQNPVDTVAATTTPDPTTAAATTPVAATTQAVPVTPATSATPTPATTDTNTTPVPANTQTSPSSSSTSSTSSSTSSVAVNTPVVSNTPTTTTPTATNANTNTRATAATQSSAAASRTVTQTLGAVSASPSSSSVAVASGSTINTGALIAGIVGGIVGVAIIVYVITWYMRRARQKEEDDAANFDAGAFRRQSAVLSDGGDLPSRSMTMNRGFNDTPASHQMFQPTADYAPVSYPTSPMSSQPGQHGSYGYDQPSFAPGQYMDMAQNPMSPNTPFSVNPTSAHPFFAPIGHSPSNSPTVAHYESAYNAQGQLVERKNSVGASQYLTRQSSMNQQYAGDEHLASDADYVDLSRASVTPFQAQQYEEISRRLNTAPPVPALPTPTLPTMPDQELAAGRAPANTRPLSLGQNITTIPPHLNIYQDNAMPESPFADPHARLPDMQGRVPADIDGDDTFSLSEAFPQPPSPAYSSNSRVTSTPPVLPEITIQQRAFSPLSHDFPPSSPPARPAPSPLSMPFSMPSPPVEAHFSEANTVGKHDSAVLEMPGQTPASPQSRTIRPDASAKRPDTVYTIYDDDDAYGGI